MCPYFALFLPVPAYPNHGGYRPNDIKVITY